MTELPRDWMLCDLGVLRVHETEGMIAQAAVWGFERPEGLTNQWKRNKWLRECREKAWDVLAGDREILPSAPYVAPEPKVKVRVEKVYLKALSVPDKSELPKPVAKKVHKGVIAASEVNAWLSELPQRSFDMK
ncbi:hypothetical protein [uncultured Roseobacter sp.]|uniref:hypothetical protein n=1 Tax=uncultured Roseobacter sp. TaxID=114847 RepID=UPI002634747D|nr:hypothetical protein [uncultured Roseobacter sp.]